MTLRRSITLAIAVAVATAVALTALASWLVVRSELYGQTDAQLRRQGAAVTAFVKAGAVYGRRPIAPPADSSQLPKLSPDEGGPLGYVQFLGSDGAVAMRSALGRASDVRLPVDETDRAIARGERGRRLRTVEVGGQSIRLLTVPIGQSGAVQIATPLNAIQNVVARLSLVLLAIGLGGVALAVALSRAVTRRVTAPVRKLADAAAHVAETDDLALRIDTDRDDELGDLARRFNVMLDRLQVSRAQLAGSVAAQRQLVADASHELRTPITALRTNLELLLEGARRDDSSEEEMLSALVEQIEELGDLVVDVIDLARGDVAVAAPEFVRLDDITRDAIARAERHHPDATFSLRAEPRLVWGAPDRLARATSNLLDNAAKHGRTAGDEASVSIVVDAQGLTVRDHGPGLAPDEIEHLFDRFYRGAGSREQTGSGLGLAIVRQVAEQHRGAVHAENAEGGGAVFTLELPPEDDAAHPS